MRHSFYRNRFMLESKTPVRPSQIPRWDDWTFVQILEQT